MSVDAEAGPANGAVVILFTPTCFWWIGDHRSELGKRDAFVEDVHAKPII